MGLKMNKESLMHLREYLTDCIMKCDIDDMDKLELMTNINLILTPTYYEENIRILRKVRYNQYFRLGKEIKNDRNR